MNADYSKMTDDNFIDYLMDILQEEGVTVIVQIPGVYEILSEYFNNEVLDAWAHDNPDPDYDEEEA